MRTPAARASGDAVSAATQPARATAHATAARGTRAAMILMTVVRSLPPAAKATLIFPSRQGTGEIRAGAAWNRNRRPPSRELPPPKWRTEADRAFASPAGGVCTRRGPTRIPGASLNLSPA